MLNGFNIEKCDAIVQTLNALKTRGIITKTTPSAKQRWNWRAGIRYDSVMSIVLKNGIKMSVYLVRQSQSWRDELDCTRYELTARFDLMSDEVNAKVSIAGGEEVKAFEVSDENCMDEIVEYVEKLAAVSPQKSNKAFWCEVIRNSCYSVIGSSVSAEEFFDGIVTNAMDYIELPSKEETTSMVRKLNQVTNAGGSIAEKTYEKMFEKQRKVMQKIAHAFISGEIEI